ncbi:hypothetical protein AMAG_13067 [Allomyces macrogynus ATCC 38327]|uniref:Uncharacterized protein n=1 Tax=Allomyces macrogynus (strain ATCC 38327) TaxID=578462 RepID=A0A0L0T0X3_ALLM3|nr:hypothetical protein AMAG_13067 [Allomyces macrogynus ATCC 38327]|eukprot:KNE68411.1 hypothetical protein AMAG_13067 [Allomyces macrogynus ATCC 38327]
MYAHDATTRPRVSSRLAPQLPERPARPASASSGSEPPTPAGSRPDSPTKKPATRRPVGAGLLDTVTEVRPMTPVATMPDVAVHTAQAQVQLPPPPLPAPRATSPVSTFASSPITGPTAASPRARAPTSLSPAHASSGSVPRRHASVAGDHYLPNRTSSGAALIPTLTATASFHQTHVRTDSFQSTTTSAASAAPSTRTTAAASIVRSGARRARKFVSHWNDGTATSSTDRRTSASTSDGLLESYRLRGIQLHADALGIAEQFRVVRNERDALRAQLDTPVAARGEDRAEARRRDRELRAHLAAAAAAAKRGDLVLADVQADVDARLEAVANQMAAETMRAKVLEMQVRSFGLAPASEVPGVLESVEVGGDVAGWRKLVVLQAREIDESAARFWVAMHDAEVAHARAVAELAEVVLVQAGGKPKEIRRGEVVDPGKMLARIRKERDADEVRWKEEEAKFKLEQEEKVTERAKNDEAGVDESAGSTASDQGVRAKLHDSAQGDDLAATTTSSGSLTAGNSTDAAPAQDDDATKPMASARAASASQLKTRATDLASASASLSPAAVDVDGESMSLMAMAVKATKLEPQAPAATAADLKAPTISSTIEPRAASVSDEAVSPMARALQGATLTSRSPAAPTTVDSNPTTTASGMADPPRATNAVSTTVAPRPANAAAPTSPTRKPLPIPPRVTDPILQALDPGFKTAADAPTVAKSTSEAAPKGTRAVATTTASLAKPEETKPVEPVPVTKSATVAVEPAAKPAPAKPTTSVAAPAQPAPRVSVDGAVRQTALLAQLMQAKRAGGAGTTTTTTTTTMTHAPKPVHAPKLATGVVKPGNSSKVAPAPVEKTEMVELPPLAPVEDVLGAGFLDLDLDLGFGLGFDSGGLGLMGDL